MILANIVERLSLSRLLLLCIFCGAVPAFSWSARCDCWAGTKVRKLLVSTLHLARDTAASFSELRSSNSSTTVSGSSSSNSTTQEKIADVSGFLTRTLTSAFCSRVFLEGDTPELLDQLEQELGEKIDRSKFGGQCTAGEAVLTLLCADTLTSAALFRTAAETDVTDFYLAKAAHQWEVFLYLWAASRTCFVADDRDRAVAGSTREDIGLGSTSERGPERDSFATLGLTDEIVLANYQDFARKFHSGSWPRSAEFPAEYIGLCGAGRYELSTSEAKTLPEQEELCRPVAKYPQMHSKTECFARMMGFYGDREAAGLHPLLRDAGNVVAPRSGSGSPDLDEESAFLPSIWDDMSRTAVGRWEELVAAKLVADEENGSLSEMREGEVDGSGGVKIMPDVGFAGSDGPRAVAQELGDRRGGSKRNTDARIVQRSFRGERQPPISFQAGRRTAAPDTFFLRADGCEIAECATQSRLSRSLALVFLYERVQEVRTHRERLRRDGVPITAGSNGVGDHEHDPLTVPQFLQHAFFDFDAREDATGPARGGAAHNHAVIFSLLCGSRAWVGGGYFPALWRHPENQNSRWVERATAEHARIAGTRSDQDVFASLGVRTPWDSMLFASRFRFQLSWWERRTDDYCREVDSLSGLDLAAEEALVGKMSSFRAQQLQWHREGYSSQMAPPASAGESSSSISTTTENNKDTTISNNPIEMVLANVRVTCALYLVWPAEKQLLDDHLIATLPYCDGAYILISLSNSPADERSYWNLQSRLGQEQATGRIRNYQVLNLFPTIPPDVWFATGSLDLEEAPAPSTAGEDPASTNDKSAPRAPWFVQHPSKASVPRNLLQKTHAGIVSIADAEQIEVAAENWNEYVGAAAVGRTQEDGPLGGLNSEEKQKPRSTIAQAKSRRTFQKDFHFPSWICLLESKGREGADILSLATKCRNLHARDRTITVVRSRSWRFPKCDIFLSCN